MKDTTLDGLKRYVQHRIPPGDFLRAVLENDLKEAFGRADAQNTEDMKDIVMYVYNYMPLACQGSPEKVDEWLKGKGNEKNETFN